MTVSTEQRARLRATREALVVEHMESENRHEFDVLQGGNRDDDMDGGIGDDTLRGGDGDDFLEGGFGNDECDGENGVDEAANCEVVGSIP